MPSSGITNTNIPPSSLLSICHEQMSHPAQGHSTGTVPPQLPSPVGCSYYKVTCTLPSQLPSLITLASIKCPPKTYPTFSQNLSNLYSFYKSLHQFRTPTAAPCSPLRDPGQDFPQVFFFSYLSADFSLAGRSHSFP